MREAANNNEWTNAAAGDWDENSTQELLLAIPKGISKEPSFPINQTDERR